MRKYPKGISLKKLPRWLRRAIHKAANGTFPKKRVPHYDAYFVNGRIISRVQLIVGVR